MSEDHRPRVRQMAHGLARLTDEAGVCRRDLAHQLVVVRMSLEDLERRLATSAPAPLVAVAARSLACGAADLRELAGELRWLEAKAEPKAGEGGGG